MLRRSSGYGNRFIIKTEKIWRIGELVSYIADDFLFHHKKTFAVLLIFDTNGCGEDFDDEGVVQTFTKPSRLMRGRSLRINDKEE